MNGAPRPLSGKRVLVVEDEMLVAMFIEDALTEQGSLVIGPATVVSDALALLRREKIDVAVLDVSLNEEETYPVAEELHRQAIPFIFATGYGASGVKSGYEQHGTLQKPFQESQLIALLHDALGSSASWPTDATAIITD